MLSIEEYIARRKREDRIYLIYKLRVSSHIKEMRLMKGMRVKL